MKTNFDGSAAPGHFLERTMVLDPAMFLEQTMDITSLVRGLSNKPPVYVAFGSGRTPELADLVFEDFAGQA